MVISSHIHGVLNGSLLIDGARFSCRILLDIVGFEMLHYSSGNTSRRVPTRTVSTAPLQFACAFVEILHLGIRIWHVVPYPSCPRSFYG